MDDRTVQARRSHIRATKRRTRARRKYIAAVFSRPGAYQVFYGPDDDADVVHVDVSQSKNGRIDVRVTEPRRLADVKWSAKVET